MISRAPLILLVLALGLPISPALSPPNSDILYVDDDATAGGTGSSWNEAIRHLQDALTAARLRGDVAEIRVAQGVYRPDLGQGVPPGTRTNSFDLVDGVVLRGGYAGLGANDPDLYDPDRYNTTLSGDLLGDDGPNFTNTSDNVYRVVRATTSGRNTLLAGCTITGSQIDPGEELCGGGLFCSGGALIIRECRFTGNIAYCGGAISVFAADVQIIDCAFLGNRAGNGGAIRTQGAFPDLINITVERCHFSSNDTDAGFGDGGAMSMSATIATVRDCTFTANRAHRGGAVISNTATSTMQFDRCTFADNVASDGGGATSGGGIYRDCRFDDNYASDRGGAHICIDQNPARHPKFIGCEFTNNRSNIHAGGAVFGGAAFMNCAFIGNASGLGGGSAFAPGGAIRALVPALIANCTFGGNVATGNGGAVASEPGASASIFGCSFAGNASWVAGEAVSDSAIICNSIFGPHDGPPLSGVTSVDYSCLPPAFPFAGGIGNIAADPRFVDPLGPDGVAGTEDDDLRLRADSPCIDAGDSTALPADQFDLDGDGDITEPLPIDMLGNRRVLFSAPHTSPPDTGIPDGTGAIIDMGAHEFRRPVDCAPPTPPIGDGFVNIDDLLLVIGSWGRCDPNAPCLADINADGVVDIHDLLAVLSGWG